MWKKWEKKSGNISESKRLSRRKNGRGQSGRECIFKAEVENIAKEMY